MLGAVISVITSFFWAPSSYYNSILSLCYGALVFVIGWSLLYLIILGVLRVAKTKENRIRLSICFILATVLHLLAMFFVASAINDVFSVIGMAIMLPGGFISMFSFVSPMIVPLGVFTKITGPLFPAFAGQDFIQHPMEFIFLGSGAINIPIWTMILFFSQKLVKKIQKHE